jgi:hypothetical protein
MPASDPQAFDNGYNDTLKLTQFALSVPAAATVLGIEFSVDKSSDDGMGSDGAVFVLRGGSQVGTDHRSSVAWPTAFASTVYGGPADTWGAGPWTAGQINDPGFGVAITPQYAGMSSAGTVHVDSVLATVTYDVACE